MFFNKISRFTLGKHYLGSTLSIIAADIKNINEDFRKRLGIDRYNPHHQLKEKKKVLEKIFDCFHNAIVLKYPQDLSSLKIVLLVTKEKVIDVAHALYHL